MDTIHQYQNTPRPVSALTTDHCRNPGHEARIRTPVQGGYTKLSCAECLVQSREKRIQRCGVRICVQLSPGPRETMGAPVGPSHARIGAKALLGWPRQVQENDPDAAWSHGRATQHVRP